MGAASGGRAEAAAPGTPYRLAAPGMTRPAAGGPEGAERQCAGGRAAAQSTPTRLRPAAGLTPPPPATGRRRSDSAMTGRKLAQSKSRQRQRPAPEWSLGGGLRACRALIGPLASGRALSGRPGGGGPLRSHNWASACSVRTVPADVRVDPSSVHTRAHDLLECLSPGQRVLVSSMEGLSTLSWRMWREEG